jgi:capsular polysaccharide biosynthesis protein
MLSPPHDPSCGLVSGPKVDRVSSSLKWRPCCSLIGDNLLTLLRELGWFRPADVGFIAGLGLAAAIVAFLVTGTFPPTYQGSTSLLVAADFETTDSLTAAQILTQTYAELATTGPVLDAVIARLHLTDSTDQLRQRVAAVAVRDTVSIVVNAAQPDTAAATANAIATELLTAGPGADPRIDAAQQLLLDNLAVVDADIKVTESRIAALQSVASPMPSAASQLDGLESQLATLLTTQATLLGPARQPGPLTIRIVDPAVADPQPTSPRALLNAAVALMGGLAVGAVTVYLLRGRRAAGLGGAEQRVPDEPR